MSLKIDVYKKKNIWKWGLLFGATCIIGISLLYTNSIVKKVASDERRKITLWVSAIQRKAALVNYTNDFFSKIEAEERKRVELWAEAMQHIIDADFSEDLSFYSKIITQNTNIPVIVTDINNRIITSANVELPIDTIKYLQGNLMSEFTENQPLFIKDIQGRKIQNVIYFKESLLFSELRVVLKDLIDSFFSEIVTNNPGVPVIVTDSVFSKVYAHGNIDTNRLHDNTWLKETCNAMKTQNRPINISLAGEPQKFVFYQDSYLLTQLRYYPLIQFIIIGIFFLIAYILFSISRRSEQNKVWVGMAKETAHQLGTPLSSMMAWLELMREKWGNDELIEELTKDVLRLENVTERFSKIGSLPVLEITNIYELISEILAYIKARSPQKVNMRIDGDKFASAPINKNLFTWVVENICKNAVDAMEGKGSLSIIVETDVNKRQVFIDFSDTGKGIPKSKFKRVFLPGYTTKSRGWGLGLTLAARIIQNYHHGKIFVKQSTINKGTTFRIILHKRNL